MKNDSQAQDSSSKGKSESKKPNPEIQFMEINPNSITLAKNSKGQWDKLGKGGFGEVYRGNYNKDGKEIQVAIKQLLIEESQMETEDFQEMKTLFIKEMDQMLQMAGLRSIPNVVRLYGYCLQPNLLMIMEYMPRGSLRKVLLDKNIQLDWSLRMKIAHGIASGLNFLHMIKIIHRDIKSNNIVLDEDFTPKICDFGLAKTQEEANRIRNSSASKFSIVGTKFYIAPEIYRSFKALKSPIYSEKTDIYALGIVFWEIASREKLFLEFGGSPNFEELIISGYRDKIPNDCPNSFANIIQACWDQDPQNRPNANKIVNDLEAMLSPKMKPKTQVLVPDPLNIDSFSKQKPNEQNVIQNSDFNQTPNQKSKSFCEFVFSCLSPKKKSDHTKENIPNTDQSLTKTQKHAPVIEKPVLKPEEEKLDPFKEIIQKKIETTAANLANEKTKKNPRMFVIGRLMMKLGILYSKCEDYQKSLNYFKDILDCDNMWKIDAVGCVSYVFEKLGNTLESEKYYNKSEEHKISKVHIYSIMGDLEILKSLLEKIC